MSADSADAVRRLVLALCNADGKRRYVIIEVIRNMMESMRVFFERANAEVRAGGGREIAASPPARLPARKIDLWSACRRVLLIALLVGQSSYEHSDAGDSKFVWGLIYLGCSFVSRG